MSSNPFNFGNPQGRPGRRASPSEEKEVTPLKDDSEFLSNLKIRARLRPAFSEGEGTRAHRGIWSRLRRDILERGARPRASPRKEEDATAQKDDTPESLKSEDLKKSAGHRATSLEEMEETSTVEVNPSDSELSDQERIFRERRERSVRPKVRAVPDRSSEAVAFFENILSASAVSNKNEGFNINNEGSHKKRRVSSGSDFPTVSDEEEMAQSSAGSDAGLVSHVSNDDKLELEPRDYVSDEELLLILSRSAIERTVPSRYSGARENVATSSASGAQELMEASSGVAGAEGCPSPDQEDIYGAGYLEALEDYISDVQARFSFLLDEDRGGH